MNSNNQDKITVLVVDDSAEALGMINTILVAQGVMVLIALNGQQALDILEKIQVDIILMDALMPIMDGFEASRQIRTKQPLIPIIFMTGLSEEEHLVKAFEAGANDYIVKPIRAAELGVRIHQHTHSAKLLREAQQALDQVQQHVFCVDHQGQVLWSTPQAQMLLDELNPKQADLLELQEKIAQWIKVCKDGHDLALPLPNQQLIYTIRYFKMADEQAFLLKIQSPNASVDPLVLEQGLNITSRQAEVLLWLAHGKTNREIAKILDMSPRTVNKHLEQVYTKMAVDNRTAAASIAIQIILGGRLGKPIE